MTTPTVNEVLRYLAELPDMCALLPEAAIVRTPRGEGSRGTPGPRPPRRLDVLHLLDTRDKGWAFDVPPDPCRVISRRPLSTSARSFLRSFLILRRWRGCVNGSQERHNGPQNSLNGRRWPTGYKRPGRPSESLVGPYAR